MILKLTHVELAILNGAKCVIGAATPSSRYGSEEAARGRAVSMHRCVWSESPGNTSKKLDKYVVVRVILHGQCSLQRKEAI